MSITHIVLFTFKAGTDAHVIKDVRTSLDNNPHFHALALVSPNIALDRRSPSRAAGLTCDRMLALKDKCVHPTTNQSYIKSSSGGSDNSIEGLQAGITHAFVVEFASAEDRDYYVKEDPAHREFVKSLDGVLEKGQVIDYTPGVFASA
ncbi:hypothetical protein N7539_003982 [Penicillium diatomitis]|uniref:Stress-response A/B barrel domain-containing protein n=1 Tax=Penicillium diatomitis TaxID=2819901 RepID=A0A9W9XD46_9EURO|nr:uncharacterized protein N7539_003982 [Penicillium diatomitis]KAJ5489092.1 hypothetical protein N7539_003982 [Penicillium diatomitis]